MGGKGKRKSKSKKKADNDAADVGEEEAGENGEVGGSKKGKGKGKKGKSGKSSKFQGNISVLLDFRSEVKRSKTFFQLSFILSFIYNIGDIFSEAAMENA